MSQVLEYVEQGRGMGEWGAHKRKKQKDESKDSSSLENFFLPSRDVFYKNWYSNIALN